MVSSRSSEPQMYLLIALVLRADDCAQWLNNSLPPAPPPPPICDAGEAAEDNHVINGRKKLLWL